MSNIHTKTRPMIVTIPGTKQTDETSIVVPHATNKVHASDLALRMWRKDNNLPAGFTAVPIVINASTHIGNTKPSVSGDDVEFIDRSNGW